MSTNLKQLYVCTQIDLKELSGLTAAVDMSQLCYRTLIALRKGHKPLVTSKGIITSHLYGALSYFLSLKRYNITPVCVYDSATIPPLKKEECIKRATEKAKAKTKYQSLVQEAEFYMNEYGVQGYYEELKRQSDKSVSVGSHIASLIDLTKALGYRHCSIEGQDAEKVCANLVKTGQADFVISRDTDVLQFGQSSYYDFNFTKGKAVKRDLDLTLSVLNVNLTELRLLGIAAGNDYTKGLKKVGAKIALKLLQKGQLLERLQKQILNFKEVLSYIQEDLSVKYQEYQSASLSRFESLLSYYEFSEKTISKYGSSLFSRKDL